MKVFEVLKEYWRPFIFCIFAGGSVLVSYNWIRSSSPSLFMNYYSKDLLPIAMATMAFTLVFVLYLYNKILTRFGVCKTFHITNFTFVGLILLHYFLLEQKVAWSSFSLFVLKDIYVMIMLEQVWSYFNTVNSVKSAKLLNGPLMAIVSIFTISSGKFLSKNITEIGSEKSIMIGGLILIIASLAIHKGLVGLEIPKKKDQEKTSLGIQELKNNPTLMALFFVIFISQMLAATTTLRFQSAVSDFIVNVDQQTGYFANYYANINSVALVFQFIITPLVLNFVPLSYVHLGIPLLHTFFGLLVLQERSLERITFASMAFKSIDYSLFKGAKEMIYVPLSDEVRYRTKQIIDVFGYRLGKGTVSSFLGFLKSGLKMADITYSYVAVGSAVIWIGLGYVISKSLKKEV